MSRLGKIFMTALTQFLIRPARLDDAEAIYTVYRKAFATLAGKIDPPSSAGQATLDAIRDSLGKVDVAVCDDAGKIVGCVFFRQEGDACYLYRLSVDPDCYNRGIAKRLIAHVERAAKGQGVGKVALNVRLSLDKNRKLFVSRGFREVSLHAHKGYDHPTYARMEKPVAL